MSAADLKPWPTCPTCQQPYTVSVGLPVVITRAGLSDRYVEVDVDVAEASDLDDSASVSCHCGTLDPDTQPDTWTDLGAALDELPRLRPVTAVYDRTDVDPDRG